MLVLYVGLGAAQFLLLLSSRNGRPFMLVSALDLGSRWCRSSRPRSKRPNAPSRTRALSRPVSQFARSAWWRSPYRDDFSIIFAMGRSTRGSAVPGPGGCVFMAVSHSAAVLTHTPSAECRTHGSAHGHRQRLHARHAGGGRHRGVRPPASSVFSGAGGALQRLALTLYPGRLACERQARAGARWWRRAAPCCR